MAKTQRNYGIDLLRILSIFMVAVLHVSGHGGILVSVSSPWDRATAWFLETLAFPAVNCFVLISGFVGYRGEKYTPKLQNILSIFFTVLFYSVSMCALVQLLAPNAVSLQDIKNSFLPLLRGQYWFYSSYLGVYLLSPFLNFFVYKASAKQLYISALVVAFISLSSLEADAFTLSYGYSVIWFAFLYLLGAILKKQDVPARITGRTCVLVTAGAFLLTWLPLALFPLTQSAFLQGHAGYLLTYNSPTVLLMAIGWLCLFSKITCRPVWQKVIAFFSTSAFSVYLIHDNRYIRELFMRDTFVFAVQYPAPVLALIVIGSAAAILVLCTLLDKIRIFLFRIAKVDAVTDWLARIIKTAVNKSWHTLCKK